MSLITKRVARDLQHIVDQATPSATAWDSIQARLDREINEPDTEDIMLAPNDPRSQKRSW